VAHTAPHWPFQPPNRPSPPPGTGALQLPDQQNTATRADYAAMVESVDRGVGRILATLDRRQLQNDTLVIFTNDNGGEWLSDNSGLSNRKWTVGEGGIRDIARRLRPLLAEWERDIEAEALRNVPEFVRMMAALPGYVGGARGAPPARGGP
jgi:arylsulfatase A-like enzyme